MGELMNRAAQLRRPPHPLTGILKQKYEEALSLIDKRAARKDQVQHAWRNAIAQRFTVEQRWSFFAAGTSDRELSALAAADTPTRQHLLTMDREFPMRVSHVIASYRLGLVRSPAVELIVYEGCCMDSDTLERSQTTPTNSPTSLSTSGRGLRCVRTGRPPSMWRSRRNA